MFVRKVAVVFLLLASPIPVLATNKCTDLFDAQIALTAQGNVVLGRDRAKLISQLKAKAVPAFMKETAYGDLPVVLVNHSTAPKIAEFMSSTIGMQILLQPNTNYTDHGLLRIGGISLPDPKNPGTSRLANVQIDWAMPDTRNWEPGSLAEINSTGLAWRDLDQLMEKAAKSGRSKVTIELAYKVTAAQKSAFEFYQRIRRSAMTGLEHPNPQGEMKPLVPNLIPEKYLAEDCFDLSKGRSLEKINAYLEKEMRSRGLDPVQTLKSRAGKAFLTEARKLIMTANLWDAETFNHELLMRHPELVKQGTALLPKAFEDSGHETEIVLNSLVTYAAAQELKGVYDDLKINGDIFPRNTLNNPKLAAVLIYAPDTEAPQFKDASFVTQGKFQHSGWGQDADGTIPYPDQKPLR